MSLFRVNPDAPFKGPHQSGVVATHGSPPKGARGAMIMIHGRGASATSILSLAHELARPDFHYVAPQADGNTWYPYSFLVSKERNEPGISSGLQRIYDLLQDLQKSGINSEKTILLGFSQGACLVTEFAARHPGLYGGVIGLSGGLIGPEIDPENYTGDMKQTPVFLGCSNVDPHIPKERVDETESVFKDLKADTDKRIYQGMGHTVNEDEIKAIRDIMATVTGKS